MCEFMSVLQRISTVSRTVALLLVLVLALPVLAGDEHEDEGEHEHVTEVERAPVTDLPAGEAVVEINGLVCSFCAFGAEKAVKRLNGSGSTYCNCRHFCNNEAPFSPILVTLDMELKVDSKNCFQSERKII